MVHMLSALALWLCLLWLWLWLCGASPASCSCFRQLAGPMVLQVQVHASLGTCGGVPHHCVLTLLLCCVHRPFRMCASLPTVSCRHPSRAFCCCPCQMVPPVVYTQLCTGSWWVLTVPPLCVMHRPPPHRCNGVQAHSSVEVRANAAYDARVTAVAVCLDPRSDLGGGTPFCLLLVFSMGTPPGTKIKVVGARIVRHKLLLGPQNTTVLGGNVIDLVTSWKANRVRCRRFGFFLSFARVVVPIVSLGCYIALRFGLTACAFLCRNSLVRHLVPNAKVPRLALLCSPLSPRCVPCRSRTPHLASSSRSFVVPCLFIHLRDARMSCIAPLSRRRPLSMTGSESRRKHKRANEGQG